RNNRSDSISGVTAWAGRFCPSPALTATVGSFVVQIAYLSCGTQRCRVWCWWESEMPQCRNAGEHYQRNRGRESSTCYAAQARSELSPYRFHPRPVLLIRQTENFARTEPE